jgi:hypothetical protein
MEKKCLTSLAIKEVQIKTTLRFYLNSQNNHHAPLKKETLYTIGTKEN